MRQTTGQILLWTGMYLALTLVTLVLVLVGPLPPARGFWIEFGVGLGFVGLAMLGLQFALTARFRRIASPFGLDTMLQFHRQAGILAVVLVLAHPLILILAEPQYASFLDPRVSAARAAALFILLAALFLLIVTSLWRRPLRIAYEWWRSIHGALAFVVVFVGLVHVLRVGYYISVPWKQAVWVGMTGVALVLLIWARVVKPLKMRGHPYRVVRVRPEHGNAWTLRLEPVGHPGLRFEAGQFAWLTLGPSPFSIEQHPFSFSSSARARGGLEFTIKELGDFTARIGSVRPGTPAFLEGPYGAFVLDPHASARGVVFVVGGVGITPVVSMLRTLRDDGDRRPVVLVYANPTEDSVIFRDELADLQRVLDLNVVHVLEHPPFGWIGERGRVDAALLDRYLPVDFAEHWVHFVCGPEAMMDSVETELLRRGVSLGRLHSERFNIA